MHSFVSGLKKGRKGGRGAPVTGKKRRLEQFARGGREREPLIPKKKKKIRIPWRVTKPVGGSKGKKWD